MAAAASVAAGANKVYYVKSHGFYVYDMKRSGKYFCPIYFSTKSDVIVANGTRNWSDWGRREFPKFPLVRCDYQLCSGCYDSCDCGEVYPSDKVNVESMTKEDFLQDISISFLVELGRDGCVNMDTDELTFSIDVVKRWIGSA